jgi:hypothetical protein
VRARVLWLLLALSGCPKGDRVDGAAGEPAAILDQARARPVPDPLKTRFSVKIRSKPLGIAGTVGGGLIVRRPGQGRLDLFGPMGGGLLTVASDGAGLSVLVIGKQQDLVATDAEQVLRDTTGGVAGLDDVLAVLVGDLPFDGAPVKSAVRVGPKPGDAPADADGPKPDDGILVILEGPKDTTVEALLDAELATPKHLVARDANGKDVLTATYDAFAPADAIGGALMPTRVEVYIPALDLSIEAKYRDWVTPEEPLGSFTLDAPDGYDVRSLEQAVLDAAKKLGETP